MFFFCFANARALNFDIYSYLSACAWAELIQNEILLMVHVQILYII